MLERQGLRLALSLAIAVRSSRFVWDSGSGYLGSNPSPPATPYPPFLSGSFQQRRLLEGSSAANLRLIGMIIEADKQLYRSEVEHPPPLSKGPAHKAT